MKVGLVLPTEQTNDYDPTAHFRAVARQAGIAERAGMDSVWVGEHHFTERTYFDNFQTLSYLAAATETVALGTSVCLAPLYNPVQLAERVANLDVMSGGRAVLGCGLGYRPDEFEILGIDRSTRLARLRETLDLLERLWSDDGVSYEGEVFSFDGVSINPKPAQEGGPPVWLGGGVPAAVRRAADRGHPWFPGPSASRSRLAELYEVYDEALADRGAGSSARPLWREVFVHDDSDRALELARPSIQNKYETYAGWGNESVDAASTPFEDRFEDFAAERFLIGTPEDVVEEAQSYRDAFDLDHLLVRTGWPGMDADTTEGSLRLFADAVLPRL